MNSATTLAAPIEDTASDVTNEESTPPDSPTTTRSNPTLRMPSAMKSRSKPATKPASIARVSAAESVGLCVVDIVSFVAKQRIRHPRPPQLTPFQGVEQHGLSGARERAEHGAEGPDDARSAPEPHPVLEPGAVAVGDVPREQLRVRPGHDVVAPRGAEGLALEYPAARRRRRADEQVDPLASEQRGRGGMPEVFADEDAGSPRPAGMSAERRGGGSGPVARRHVALLVEQPVRWEVHLAVHVHHLTGAEVHRGVVEAMAVALENEPHHDVDVRRP